MQTQWTALALFVFIGILSIRLMCSHLVRSCDLFIPPHELKTIALRRSQQRH